jgi:hypothetical protein
MGDASETGLIKFVHPILDVNEFRNKYPVFSYTSAEGAAMKAEIPFSSAIKFNLCIRDLNESIPKPAKK